MPGVRLAVPCDRVFDLITVDEDGRPRLNEARVRFGLGKRVLIGLTEVGPAGETSQRQFLGVLASADPLTGIRFSLDGGGSYLLPPDGRALEEARPGSHRLRSKGEVVVDPDYTCSWTVHLSDSSDAVSDRGYEP